MSKTLRSLACHCVLCCALAACGRNPMLDHEEAGAGPSVPTASGGSLQGGGGAGGATAAGTTAAASGGGGTLGGASEIVGGRGGAGAAVGSGRGGTVGSGGRSGRTRGSGGASVVSTRDGGLLPLPDGGLAGLLGDGGLVNGLLDAPRDSVIGQVVCGPEVSTGAPCPSTSRGCLLPSLGGVCACLNGTYLCPADPAPELLPCPGNATTGSPCSSALTTCAGGGATACVCWLGTYICY